LSRSSDTSVDQTEARKRIFREALGWSVRPGFLTAISPRSMPAHDRI
jgi:hypothetical protein